MIYTDVISLLLFTFEIVNNKGSICSGVKKTNVQTNSMNEVILTLPPNGLKNS